MGRPEDKLADFIGWEEQFLNQDIHSDPDHSRRDAAMGEIVSYFMGLIAQRLPGPHAVGRRGRHPQSGVAAFTGVAAETVGGDVRT